MNNLDKEAVTLKRQPNVDDPLERSIRSKLESIASGEKMHLVIDTMVEDQTDFFEYCKNNLNSPEDILTAYRNLLQRLARLENAHIVSGEEHLTGLRRDSNLIVVTNHFGIAKLTRISNFNRRFPVDLDEIESFPSRHATFLAIAEKLHLNLREVAVELPGFLLDVQKACGVITVPAVGSGRTEELIINVKAQTTANEKVGLVMYPEGGTSGKRNGGGPYDLDHFHAGAFVVAAITKIPILPVCQYFSPRDGFQLHILSPLTLDDADLKSVKEVAENTQKSMQDKLHDFADSP